MRLDDELAYTDWATSCRSPHPTHDDLVCRRSCRHTDDHATGYGAWARHVGRRRGPAPRLAAGAGGEDAVTLTFTIPKSLWLTANRVTTNRGYRARLVADLQHLAAAAARAAHLEPTDGPVALDWTIRYPKGVRRDKGDPVNAAATTKALLDGLVPHWLPDDGPLVVIAETFRRGPNLDRAGDHEIRLLMTDQAVPF